MNDLYVMLSLFGRIQHAINCLEYSLTDQSRKIVEGRVWSANMEAWKALKGLMR